MKKPTALEQLRGMSWRCGSCDEEHEGLFDLGTFSPDYWNGPPEQEPNAALRMDGDFLSEDFCVIEGAHYFVRGVLEIPVHGLEERFAFGIWSSLSRKNFDIYVDAFDDADYADFGPWTGWFSNSLLTFPETLNQPCWVQPRQGRQRPLISLADEDHELAAAAREGISVERMMEIYAAHGHRPVGL